MGMTPVTHDTVCNQMSQTNMTRMVGYVAQFHANYASDDVPLGDASNFNCKFGSGNSLLQPYDYMKKWAATMRAAGLHVMFRGNWNTWKVSNGTGNYGQPSLTYLTSPAIPYEGPGGLAAVLRGADTTSYIGKTYQWILHHPDVYQDGDIFEPFGEAQNNGILNGPRGSTLCSAPYCQFPTTAAFNQWLSDFSQADQAAFTAIGKKVTSGWFGLSGDSYNYLTAAAMSHSSAYNLDHFNPQCSFSHWQAGVTGSHAAMPNMTIALEFGDNCDTDATVQQVAATTDQYLGWLVQQPYVSGVEWWDESGQGPGAQSAAVDYGTGQMTPAGQVVAKYFALMDGGAAPTATSTSTPVPPAPTKTPVPPTATNTVAPPTVTKTPIAPIATSTRTPVSPTATKTHIPPTATNTAAPATATNTPIPPTATNTAVPTTPPAPGRIAFVQSTAQLGQGSSLTSSYASIVGAGDLLVGTFRSQGSTSVSDKLNGAWTQAAKCGVVTIWYAANAKAGATTVTLTSGSVGQMRISLSEYSGAARASPLDATACSAGSTTGVTATSGAAIPAGELAYAGLGSGSNPATVTAGTIGSRPATLRAQMTGNAGTIAVEDVTATAAGQQNASMTLSASSGGWNVGLVTFKHQ